MQYTRLRDRSNPWPLIYHLSIGLLEIQKEQDGCKEFHKFQVMELSATSRGGDGNVVELTEEEKNPPGVIPTPPTEPIHHVWMRLTARKGIKFHPVKGDEIAKNIGILARRWKSSGKAVLVFVRTIEDVKMVHQMLTDKKEGMPADQVQVLTGTLRGLERDRLAKDDPIFARFLLKSQTNGRTVYLICTSAGEVGVDMSADHLVCDLTTLDSMIQRLGRVNRRGGADAEVDVVYENEPDPKKKDKEYDRARWNTLALLRKLPVCNWINERQEGSPLELRNLLHADDEEGQKRKDAERAAAFAPPPTILPATDILFDAWALTTIKEKLPGRPPVDQYLHGLEEEKQLDTIFAWREEVAILQLANEPTTAEIEEREEWIEGYLEEYPLKPHELLTERTYRALDALKTLAKSVPGQPAWNIDADGAVHLLAIGDLASAGFGQLIGRTIVLPPDAGALTATGMLSGQEPPSPEIKYDVADHFPGKATRPRVRFLFTSTGGDSWKLLGTGPDFGQIPDTRSRLSGMKQIPSIRLNGDDDGPTKQLFAFVGPETSDGDETRSRQAGEDQLLHGRDGHLAAVERYASLIAAKLLPEDKSLQTAVVLAAQWHDLGKDRDVWQRSIGNTAPNPPLAKSKTAMRFRELEGYRHEFGSLLDVLDENQGFRKMLDQQAEEVRELVLHLIAVHHGFGRPHFPVDKAFDQKYPEDLWKELAAEIPRRFARLQRRYGRWGLAFLESLLRAADYAASANPSHSEGRQ